MSEHSPEFFSQVVTGKPDVYALELDGTKIGWWRDRVEAWARGEKIAPITMDVAWTRKCNAACDFCVFPDTPVLMADGSTKPMVDVRPGDRVASMDDVGRPSMSLVSHHFKTSPLMPGLQLETRFGKLKCTADHLILTDNGWIAARELRVGDYVYGVGQKEQITRSDEQQKSDEGSGRRGEKEGNIARPLRRGPSLETVQTFMARGEDKGSTALEKGEEAVVRPYESIQSDEGCGCGCEDACITFPGGSQSQIAPHETNVGRGKDYPSHVQRDRKREGSERNGTRSVSDVEALSWPLRRGWDVLDCEDEERDPAQSRFHGWRGQGQDGNSSARDVLAPRSVNSNGGDRGLQVCGLASSGSLDEADIEVDASSHQRGIEIVSFRSPILSIEDAGSSPVYDMECHPHHNFVAGGTVVHNCYATMQASSGSEITKKHALEYLEDAAEIGVKGVSLISDGESTVVPWFDETVEYGGKLGLQIGTSSNGVRLSKKVLERILPHLTYLRFNFSGGDKRRWSEIMGLQQKYFDVVVRNIKDAMEIKRRDNLPVNINVQMVVMPKHGDQIVPLAKLCRDELRPDYLIYKHTADSIDGGLGIDYREYSPLFDVFKEAEGYADEGFRVQVKWSRLANEGKRTYSRCYGPPFILQMSGNGLIAPCGFLFNEKYKKFHVGNITETRFRDIFQSDRYWEVMQYLANDYDPSALCGPNCLQTNTNAWLYEWKNGRAEFAEGAQPPHMGFI